MNDRMSFGDLLHFYENHLETVVMPFWMTHCVDAEHGGINNVVEDNGTVTSTDKYLWSQGRALWTFSSLYNNHDRDARWLEVAHNIAELITTHGRNPEGEWVFSLHQDGSVALGPRSIYVDAFVIDGLTEYARATGSRKARDLAVEAYRRTTGLLGEHSTLRTEPHPIPEGLQAHGPSMIFSHVYHELGLLTGNQEILDRAYELAEIIMTMHVVPERELLYEFVHPGGGLVDSDEGKTFLPGHAIESMWFMERIYQHHNRQDRIALALDVVRWSLEKGWDPEYGGIFLACHSHGGKPVWHHPDAKVWWPHTEALYALLRFYEITRQEWCMEWYWKIHEYTFGAFPNPVDGEWHQNLNRRGQVVPVVVKNLAVKDPFHLPRSLIYSIMVLRNLSSQENGGAG